MSARDLAGAASIFLVPSIADPNAPTDDELAAGVPLRVSRPLAVPDLVVRFERVDDEVDR